MRFSSFALARRARLLLIASAVSLSACGISQAATLPVAEPTTDAALSATSGKASIVLSGGCFWGVEAVYRHVNGVISATSGYAGGSAANARYDKVSDGDTGHAESVQVVYDPAKISLGQLLRVFFSVAHDPTQLNRQGPDTGTQYRSAIWFSDPDQQRIAAAYIQQLNTAKTFRTPIVTQLSPLTKFYTAEDYHQNYVRLHPYEPYIVMHDRPKVANLKEQFPKLYVEVR
ncbi:peptide-methionine (S)-S-oxide reductase MsrA [Stenotrophobium rhamnosiphilum]|uniref:Peptide methionine sulfoxide reductase MsrA n=1 Tax=Stenotrophobium rhamnosiphilum TaxID=2029166 RepID=A0A2T5MJD3_9GAMM|nr:peptide-methionine (S)-S-oxide reductase MsrA [Stenotrophobium rhamnosiphilum]PTU32674.1 peptide-methionine (S)-S-oxide reductase [Stenotrophobium rhamnosiphilum]